MKDSRINYVVVGGFVLAMLLSLLVVVAMLTGRTGSTDTYYTHLSNVNGLKYGTKVTYEGFPVGQVEEIAPLRSEGKTSFRIKLSVSEGWLIPQDSTARVAASGILAAVAVDIKGGASEQMLKPGSEIVGGPAANIFAVMNDVAGQVADLNQNALKPLLSTINQRVDTLGQVLEKQAPELMANLIAVTGDLAVKTPRITSDVERMTGTLSTKVVNDANAERIQQTLANMAQLSSGLQDSRHKVDAVLASLDKMVGGNRENVDQSLKDLRHTLQTVSRNIDSVTYNLDGTSRNLHEFSRQLRENPAVLLGGNRGGSDGPGRK
jgi:phospholipid/cholesterol/gamma-HCH transport system substrate-binding protein